MFHHEGMVAMQKFCHFEDCTVERENARAELRDEEGKLLLSVPDSWTDAQIKIAVEFSNRTYALGIEFGKALKAVEIKACLGI
ncbi:hypothetical protein [Ralstonia pseudosolanacearum]|uniref:hypothetical protein n=1 Tax=Ralstonia pseudosolanacearum TaxID=1310165 RepID=UPI003CEF1D49